MPAAKLDISIEQGTTWVLPFQLKRNGVPIDLTNAVGRCQIRTSAASATVAATPTVVLTQAELGIGKVVLTAVETAAIHTSGRTYADVQNYVWDLELELDDADKTVIRVFNGAALVSPEVTKT